MFQGFILWLWFNSPSFFYPTLTLMMDTYIHKHILLYSRDLSYGRGSTAPVKDDKLPEIVDTEPWDGKDGEVCSPASCTVKPV